MLVLLRRLFHLILTAVLQGVIYYCACFTDLNHREVNNLPMLWMHQSGPGVFYASILEKSTFQKLVIQQIRKPIQL